MTEQQRQFAELVIASPSSSAVAIYRQVYPARAARRQPATEWTAASRLLGLRSASEPV